MMRKVWTMAALLCALPAGAAAQSCWPVAVLVELRDGAGRRVDPAALDSVVTQLPGEAPEPLFARGQVRPHAARDTARYLWNARSGCHLEVGRISLFHGGQAMHLEFGMTVDSERRRGPSTFLVQAPPLQPGTFRLRWHPLEPGGTSAEPRRLDQGRWERTPPP